MSEVSSLAQQVINRLFSDHHELYLLKNKQGVVQSAYTSPSKWKHQSVTDLPKYFANTNIFDELWEKGIIYLDRIDYEGETEINIYSLSITGQMIESAKRKTRQGKPTEHMLQIMRLLSSGLTIKVFEINGKNPEFTVDLYDKKITRITFQGLMREAWIIPIRYPINFEKDGRTWIWEWGLSPIGWKIMEDHELINISKYDTSKEQMIVFMQGLAYELVGKIEYEVERLSQTMITFEIDKLLELVKEQYLRKSIDVINTDNLLGVEQARQRLNLTDREFETGITLGLIRPVLMPSSMQQVSLKSDDHLFDPNHLVLSEVDRQQIADNTFLTREEAAKHLKVSLKIFDEVMEQQGLHPADAYRLPNSRSYRLLYRWTDIRDIASNRNFNQIDDSTNRNAH